MITDAVLSAPLSHRTSPQSEMVCDSVGYQPWHVLQTEPNLEPRVMGDASRIGFRCYLPRVVVRQRRYGRDETVLRTAFPTYLFVAFNAAQTAWGELLRLRHARRFLCASSGLPAPLRTGEVERLMQLGRAGDGAIDEDATLFPVDSEIRVVGGPFVDWRGICKLDADGRVTALLTMFGAVREIVVRRELVERV